MKKIIFKLLFVLLLFPTIIYAGTYTQEVEKANDYIKKSNYVSTYEKYLITGNNTPYEYSSGSLKVNSSFKTGGFISMDEYNLSVINNSSWLFYDGYWTLSKSGSNYYAITYENRNTAKNPSSNYRSRVTQYVKNNIKVTGSGTYGDPWVFVQ